MTRSTAFVFGPQALSFNETSFTSLREKLFANNLEAWALKAASTLPDTLAAFQSQSPDSDYESAHTALEAFLKGLRTGDISSASFPLPNAVLSPLVVISQIVDFVSFVKNGNKSLGDDDRLPASIIDKAQALGLCTGILAAFAVASAQTLQSLKQYAVVSVHLAMLTGALVDAEDAKSGNASTSLSVSWPSSNADDLKTILGSYQDAYVSVHMDERRATITCSQSQTQELQQALKDKGLQVSPVSLNGRFHWAGHAKAAEKLLAFVTTSKTLRYAEIKDLVLPVRGNNSGLLQTGNLHEIAIRTILLDKALWYEATAVTYTDSLDAPNARAICFGEERAVPPTIARKLDSRVSHATEPISSSPTSGLSIAMAGGTDDRIAVIGMSCHVPNAEDLEEFWQVLLSGESQHREVPTERFSMNSVFREMDPKRKWYGNFIRDHDAFDHKFFKKSPREMSSTDPQHRIALQLAYQAVQQSGYYGNPDTDKHIGVYIGHANTDYEHNVRSYPANAYSATGNLKSLLAGKVSHYFGWTGPSLTLDTACSSSSVAIHLACRAILNGEITGALAGGVNILTSPEWYHNLAGAGFLSMTGQCKSFDSKGDGYCRGEGSGLVFLKKLSAAVADGDQILGVIASTAVLQNQNCTPITVPNSVSLAELFEGVIQKSGLKPHDITVVEAHGTGTAVGDPAEYGGIRQVLGGPSRSDRLSLTAVKGAIGHLEVASGAASLIKVLLMIHEGAVPPQASFQCINPDLNAKHEDNIDIHTSVKSWDATMRAALINNYGASGSNASMVVSEGPKTTSTRDIDAILSGKKMPFWFSGSDDASLKRYATKLKAFIQRKTSAGHAPSLANLSFQVARQSNRGLAQSLILQASSVDELQNQLDAVANGTGVASFKLPGAKPVILCFGGQISTFVGLDKTVFESVALLRHHLSNCDAVLTSLGLGSIYPHIFQTSPLHDIVKLQTSLFALQYSCAMSWIDAGVQVAAVVGHSFGELTSLCVSGILSLKDSIQLIAKRASLIQTSWGSESGAMMAMEGDLAVVKNLVSTVAKATGKDICIACYNGPRSFTLAGSSEVIHFAEQTLKTEKAFEGTRGKVLNVTNAFHCSLVDAIGADLVALSKTLVFKQPKIHLEHASQESAPAHLPEDYIYQHLRNPVYFNQAIERLSKKYPDAVFLEAGSNSTITNMVGKTIGASNADKLFSVNITSEAAYTNLIDVTTKLWHNGLPVTFWGHHKLQTPDYRPLLLPPYQFEKSRHWLEIKEVPAAAEAPTPAAAPVELEKGLINFFGVLDEVKREVRFKVNTLAPEFVKQVDSHIMAKTIGVMPGMLPVELALDAISSLRPEFRDSNFQPELQGMVYYSPLVPQHCSAVWFDTLPTDETGMTWSWKFLSQDAKGTLVKHMTGTIVFYSPQSAMVQGDFARLSRLGSYKRCQRLLGPDGADDVVVGRNIYRAFENVIDYKDIFRHVTKLVGKDGESAARVTRSHDKDGWLDSILTDCFCQVAGISVNLFSDAGDFEHRGIYIGDRVDRWIRAPGLRIDAAKPTEWDVLAMSHRESESAFVSDVFAFDARNGTLYEAILGIRYSNVSMVGICKTLNRVIAENPAQAGYAGVLEARTIPKMSFNTAPSAPAMNGNHFVASDHNTSNGTNGFHTNETPASTSPPSTSGVDNSHIPAKAKEILANLSGLEVDEIQSDSDLVEMGIDSLMAMELIREVDAAFKITLDTDQLMGLTDFQSFITCIGKALGVDVNGTSTPQANGSSSPQLNGHTNGTAATNGNGSATNGYSNGHIGGGLPSDIVHNVFRATKAATDDFIVKYKMADYYTKVRPVSTMLCAAYIVEAFEKLGCPIKSAKPGQVLARVSYLPKHEKFMKELYKIIGPQETGLVDLVGSDIIRTTVPCPAKSADALLEDALRDEPDHAPEFKLSALTGCKLAECLTGKEDGLQIIFGSAAGRKTVSDVYAVAPLNYTWIEQASSFLQELLTRLPANGEPIKILEMGAGTGGTTATLVPMLAALGVPIAYTFTDLSSSLVAAARKRFKQYPFMQFQVVNIEAAPEAKLMESQHIVLANACVHATRSLPISLRNIRQMLRSDGILMLLEETEQLPWVDFVFGLLEGWWLFEDGRVHAQVSAEHWEKDLRGAGFAHVDYTDGQRREAQVQRVIFGFASDIRYDGSGAQTAYPITLSHAELTNATDRRRINDEFILKYTADFTLASSDAASITRSSTAIGGKCLLVTGATGSLGSHIVSSALQIPGVTKVVCMNRLGTVDVTARQHDAFQMRGIEMNSNALSKLKIIGTDTSKIRLGLSVDDYRDLVQSVTHIVHNAWPMSLTRTTKAYEPQFQVMRNLIDLARDCAATRPPSDRISFELISSIGAVGYYPIWTGQCLAPELPTTADTALPVGYADAKIVCERMLEETLRCYPDRFRAAGVRIAQITGSRTNGYWNPIEHFSFFVKSAQLLKSLPDLPGTMSWYPVNDVANSLLDILMSEADPYAIYQIENPSRQPWAPTIRILAEELNIPAENIIPYQDWLDKVQSCGAPIAENPAKQLMSFWETHFLRMSTGPLILDTKHSREHSETMRNSKPISEELIRKYLCRWKDAGFLDK